MSGIGTVKGRRPANASSQSIRLSCPADQPQRGRTEIQEGFEFQRTLALPLLTEKAPGIRAFVPWGPYCREVASPSAPGPVFSRMSLICPHFRSTCAPMLRRAPRRQLYNDEKNHIFVRTHTCPAPKIPPSSIDELAI